MQTISQLNWQRLVEANQIGVEKGWAAPGVFGTGIGPDYRPGNLLYVGKSAGPLGSAVGSCTNQAVSCEASTDWMIERRNSSSFWQFVDQFDKSRRSIAWTNVSKIDVSGGKRGLSRREWSEVSKACLAALKDEIVNLAPLCTLFALSRDYREDIEGLLEQLGYLPLTVQVGEECPHIDDGWTATFVTVSGNFAVITRHPQGWPNSDRDRVVRLVLSMLKADGGTQTKTGAPRGTPVPINRNQPIRAC